MPSSHAPIVAIFVGGRSRRMGGAPKGRIVPRGSGVPIVEAQRERAQSVGLDVVVVGNATEYEDLLTGISRLADDPPGIGPMGGLRAALLFAASRDVIALACDVPFVTAAILARLAAPTSADIVAVRGGAKWQAMCARYGARCLEAIDALIAEQKHSMHALFDRMRVQQLSLDEGELDALRDWDEPGDVE